MKSKDCAMSRFELRSIERFKLGKSHLPLAQLFKELQLCKNCDPCPEKQFFLKMRELNEELDELEV